MLGCVTERGLNRISWSSHFRQFKYVSFALLSETCKVMYLLSHLRDTWPDSVTGRASVPSPGRSDDDNDESDDSDEVDGDEEHIYQSLERQSRADDINVVYAMPLKHRKVQLCVECFDAFTNIHHEVELLIHSNPALNLKPTLRS